MNSQQRRYKRRHEKKQETVQKMVPFDTSQIMYNKEDHFAYIYGKAKPNRIVVAVDPGALDAGADFAMVGIWDKENGIISTSFQKIPSPNFKFLPIEPKTDFHLKDLIGKWEVSLTQISHSYQLKKGNSLKYPARAIIKTNQLIEDFNLDIEVNSDEYLALLSFVDVQLANEDTA